MLAAGCSAPPAADNVVVVLVDTLRADRLGCYGYSRPTSPRLDAFARESVVFEKAISQSSWTSPSVASLFTSVHPSAHGVERHESILGKERRTLAQEMKSAGRTTAAISTNMAFVIEQKGFGLGFDHFEMAMRDVRSGERKESFLGKVPEEAAGVTDRAIAWLTARDEAAPFFLYVHYFDPHGPYRAPGPWRNRFLDPSAPPDAGRELFGPGGSVVGGIENAALLGGLYDGEVAYVDSEIGRLLDFLAASRLLDRTAVVVTSDHGEELFEHGGSSHGTTLFQEVVHIPLIVRRPGAAGGGRRVDRTVQLVDVGPTVLALAGAPDTRKTEGRSLVPLLDAPGPLGRMLAWLGGSDAAEAEATAYSELSRPTDTAPVVRHVRSLRADGWHFFTGESGEEELYDAAADPGELTDLRRREEAAAASMRARLEAIHARSRRDAPADPATVAPTEEERERLKALGYAQ